MAGLTLPEPARSLFRSTRSILDRHVARITPGRTGFALGGRCATCTMSQSRTSPIASR